MTEKDEGRGAINFLTHPLHALALIPDIKLFAAIPTPVGRSAAGRDAMFAAISHVLDRTSSLIRFT